MGIQAAKQSMASYSLHRSFAFFGIAFFLITMILTAFVIIPKTHEIFESQHSKDIQIDLAREAKLFTNFVEAQKTILQDLAQFPSLVNAAMLSDANNPALIDLLDNVVIGGSNGRLVLQDIAGSVLIQTTHDLQGSYGEEDAWFDRLLDGRIPFHFQLLSQTGDQFTFQMSIPISYNASIEGALSAEVTVPLKQIFIAQSFDHVAFKLVQADMTVHTESEHIQIAREDSLELSDPNLTFIYITDEEIIRDKERSLRNTILFVLLTGLGVSFLLFAVFGYRSLIGRERGGGERVVLGRAYAMPIAVTVIGIAASVTAFLMIKNVQHVALEKELLSRSKEQVQNLRERIHENLQVLDSIKAFFDASNFVDLQEFRTFVTPLLANHPNIHALEWIPNVPRSERIDHENQARTAGMDVYSIRELDAEGNSVSAGLRDNYFPVYYVEPIEGNEKSIGFDHSTSSERLAVLTKASRSGNKVATAPIVLVQEEESQTGLLVYYPIYHQSVSREPVDSEAFDNVRGYALLKLRAGDLVGDGLINGQERLSIYIQDDSEPDSLVGIFGNEVANARYSFRDSIEVGGRSWRIDTTASTAVVPMLWASWLILLGGVLFTVLITAGLVHLIRRREVVESLVRQRTSELRMLSSIVANSNDSFMITDAVDLDPETGQRKIVYVNEAFTRLTGYNHEETVGNTPEFLYGEETDEIQLEELRISLAKGNSFRGEFLHYTKNSQSYWVDINVVPIKNEEGEITHYGSVQRNITDLKLAQVEREKLIGKLMDSNEELARFAFVCSHDLQEPLRMIRSFAEKLQSHIADDLVNDEKGKKYFGFITDGAERAQILIADILAYSSIENNAKQMEQIDGMALIGNIKKVMQIALEDCGGRISHDVLPDLQGNKTQLYQLFQNLINNAIKYQRPDASPHVHIGVIDAGRYWQYSIKDNGIGMEQRHLPKIFAVFQRLHRRNQYAGTGVGLSICKKVVERHGGSIWVESELGVGSVFHFTLLKPTLMEIIDERERKAS